MRIYKEKIKGRLLKIYSGKEAADYDKVRSMTPQLNLIYCREREILSNLIGEKKGKILDAACGTGRFFDLYKRMAVYGIDSSKDMIKQAKQRKIAKKLKICDAENITFPDNSFDITLSTRFIQHIPQYENVIREMVRVTKPGGKIIIDFPNKNSISYLSTQIRLRKGAIVYYNFFSLENIKKIAEKFNLEIEKIDASFLISPNIFPSSMLGVPIFLNKLSFLLRRFGYVYYVRFLKLDKSL